MDEAKIVELVSALFALLAWYFGIYETIETETEQCINRIKDLREWHEKGYLSEEFGLHDAIQKNKRPLNLFKRKLARVILIWVPIVALIIVNTFLLIPMGLEGLGITTVSVIGRYVVSVAFIVAGVFLFISLILLARVFQEHPEACYIDQFLQMDHRRYGGKDRSEPSKD